MLVALCPTHEGFVRLNRSCEFIVLIGNNSECVANPVKNKPSSPLLNSYIFSQLNTTNAFLVRSDEVDGCKPFAKWDFRILKHRSDPNTIFSLALSTFVFTASQFVNCVVFTFL